jgi:hypothetical protein
MLIETNNIQLEDLPDLASRLARVATIAHEIQWLSDGIYKPMGCILVDVEWYSLAAIAKTTSNAHAFEAMIKLKNTIAATAIVRMQIEIAMRIHGLTLVDDVEDAGTKLMKGEKYSSLAFKGSNKKLTDTALHLELSKLYQWVTAAYESTCAAVHLDRMNIGHKLVSINDKVFYNLAGVDKDFPDERYYHLVDTFFITLRMTKKLLESFLATRPQPDERAVQLDASRKTKAQSESF